MSEIKILLYHSVGKVHPRDTLGIRLDKEMFYSQMKSLKEDGCNIWTLKEAIACVKEKKSMPQKTTVITFDDGYKDNIINAAPIMEEFGFRAIFFVTVDYIGKAKTSAQRDWQHWECMDESDLVELKKRGHDIGSHSLNHVDLTKLDSASKTEEIGRSKKEIGSLLDKEVNFFSYPYGHFDEEIVKIVRDSGYEAACTTVVNGNDAASDIYRLKRTEIVNSDTLGDFKNKAMRLR
ncbi:polysaccharide deacetylase family protein [Omnitrophica bacterium]|nr:polysaccharide deacetylase family protein [Candidatus Omnitrophota bacterium]